MVLKNVYYQIFMSALFMFSLFTKLSADTVWMDKIEYRTVIKFLSLKGKSPTEMEFRCRRRSIFDEEHCRIQKLPQPRNRARIIVDRE